MSKPFLFLAKRSLLLLSALLAIAPLRAQHTVPTKSTTTAILADTAATPPYEITRRMPRFYEQLKQQLTFPMAWGRSTTTDFNQWRSEGRQLLTDCLQLLPPPPTDWQLQVEATEPRQALPCDQPTSGNGQQNSGNGRYEARRITFNVSAWSRVPAYLLVPEGPGPFPAVLLLHDHGAHFTIGKEKMVRPFGVSTEVQQDAEEWTTRCYDGSFVGDSLAARGYVVLSVDALFWGERGCQEGPDYDVQQALASNLMQMGSSWPSVIHADDLRSAELLASLPMVDSKRIGCLGFSMGAYRAWMLAAWSDVVSCSAAVSWLNTTDELMTLTNNQNKGGSAFSMLIPTLRRYMDYPHVAALACPKPALFFNGTRDKLFPVAGVEAAYTHLHEVWRSQGAEQQLTTRLWDEKHFFNRTMQQEVLRFFDEKLK